jgi:hydrogenase maturation factor
MTKKGSFFQIGKIPPNILQRTVYGHTGRKNPRLLFGPGVGIDAAAVKYGNQILVYKTDPITGTASHIGSHSVVVNANDIATTGAKPVWYLATILLPLSSRESDLEEMMKEIGRKCRELDISLIGGHCEVTRGLTRPLIIGFMTGETRGKVLTTQNARIGDRILITKTAGLEGTAILASDYAKHLQSVGEDVLKKARSLSKQISIVKEALSISRVHGVHALHDPTEGGVLNGFWELAEASGHGIEIVEDNIPVAEETRKLCSKLKLDPLRLMSSGCLIVSAAPSSIPTVSSILNKLRVRFSDVGRLLPQSKGRWIISGNGRKSLVPILQDELYRLS